MNTRAIWGQTALVISALVGGVITTLADLIQKDEASAVLSIGEKLYEIFGLPASSVAATVLVLLLAMALTFVFQSPTRKDAFYLGAGVLPLLVTLTPYRLARGFKQQPNSVEVNLSIATQGNQPAKDAVVTLWDANGRTIISRAKLQGPQLKFYQAGGTFRLTVEMSGYRSESRLLTLTEGSQPQMVSITLQPSSAPLFIQRVIR